MLFIDAQKKQLISSENALVINDNSDPLSSPDIVEALSELKKHQITPVLIFDQFEELFYKYDLFDTFNQVKNICFHIDSNQEDIILGFAWKTDISLPQNHPAYYLWHSLNDRRKPFVINEFDRSEIRKVISKAEINYSNKISPAIKARLIDQCQGFPWLLKKLLVHIFNRISQIKSQYELLENELDIKYLFEDDLSKLSSNQIECLKFIGKNSPAYITDVETQYSSEITNSLLQKHLIIRSGLNYSVYWDIFRDYLVDNKLPFIPWNKTFQREPSASIKLLKNIGKSHFSLTEASKILGVNDNTCQNIISDLLSLQIIISNGDYTYKTQEWILPFDTEKLSDHVGNQLRRHVVYKEILGKYNSGDTITYNAWLIIFKNCHKNLLGFEPHTINQYSRKLVKWMRFGKLITENGSEIKLPLPNEKIDSSIITYGRASTFLGASTWEKCLELYNLLNGSDKNREYLVENGFRNTMQDLKSLGLINIDEHGNVKVNEEVPLEYQEKLLKESILRQKTVQLVQQQEKLDSVSLGSIIENELNVKWKKNSKIRYVTSLKRFYIWAKS